MINPEGSATPPATASAAPAPPPPASPATPSGPFSPLPAKRRSRWPVYAAVAAVAVVILIVVLVTVVPGFKLGGSSSETGPLAYSKARPIADSAMAAYPGGGWTALVAAGIATPTVEQANITSNATGGSNCTFQPAAGVGPTLTVPAFSGNVSAGVAPAWEFVYRNSSGAVAIVAVLDGQGTVLGTISGTVCGGVFGLFSPIPTGVIDSSQASGAVASAAAPFLQTHSGVTAEFGLLGGVSFLGLTSGAKWSVAYTTCKIGSAASGVGAEFNATVNALTGQVVFDQTVSTVLCTGAVGPA